MADYALAGEGAKAAPSRWPQLFWGFVAMMAIASPQYVWTLFTGHLTQSLQSSLAEVQITFSILIVLQTFLSPLQGYLIEKIGPRILLSVGAVLTGVSWVATAYIDSLWGLYFTYGFLGGVGTGVIYVGVVGLMVQWFPDRRGLATGVVSAGYGVGAILTTFPIAWSLESAGFERTLITYGIVIGILGFVAAQGMRRPPVLTAAPTPATQSGVASSMSQRNFTSREMLRNPIFYVLFVMMTLMSTTGLMVISQMGSFARDIGVADAVVWGLAALPFALTVDRIMNGFSRPFFGWVSDKVGRENTMGCVFIAEGFAILIWFQLADNPLAFVFLSGLVFFAWGEIFSIFPSTLTDTFGPKHATMNYGFLYMAQGVGAILGAPVAAWMLSITQSWATVFGVVIVMDIVAGLMALLILKPMRRRHAEMTRAMA